MYLFLSKNKKYQLDRKLISYKIIEWRYVLSQSSFSLDLDFQNIEDNTTYKINIKMQIFPLIDNSNIIKMS